MDANLKAYINRKLKLLEDFCIYKTIEDFQHCQNTIQVDNAVHTIINVARNRGENE